jgi:glycosyltransferase involved in cell wall biosynthesis
MSGPKRFLLATGESHPTHRADVRVLFGESLPALGIETDLVAVRDGDARPWGGGRAMLRAPSRVADLLQQLSLFRLCLGGYDGLIVRDKPVLALIGYLAARLARIPFCYWMSFPLPAAFLALARTGDGSVGRARRAWLWLRGTAGRLILERFLIHRVDWLFVQSDVMARELRDVGLAHERVSAVPMGVDPDALPPPADALPPALRGCRLGVYLGTLDRVRRPELMVDAAVKVGAVHPDFKLLVIGDADDPGSRGWLARYAESIGASDRVHFTGRVPFAEGIALARHAVLGLSPFPRGPLLDSASPTKAIEYLACGIPVVCNDQPDQKAVVERSGGGVIVPMTSDGFADGMLGLLADADAVVRARRPGASGSGGIVPTRCSGARRRRTAHDHRRHPAGTRTALGQR